MRNFLTMPALLLLLLAPVPSLAQPLPPLPGAAPAVAPGGTVARSAIARAGDTFNALDYGAVGDGASHTAGTVLGISTLAGLAAWTAPGGGHPYAWVSGYPFGVLFNLQPAAAVAATNTTIAFAATGTVAAIIPESTAAASGATSVIVSDPTMTSDATAISSGITVSAANGCIPAGATISGAVTGFSGYWTAPISAAATCAIPSNTLITFGVRPATGSYTLPVVWTSGLRQGDLVTDAGGCIPAGAQVEMANPARMEVILSAATTCQVPTSDVLTFIPSWLSRVASGMTVTGPTGAFAAGSTVSSVNTSTGVVTLSAAATGAVTPQQAFVGVTSPTTGQEITFWRAYTDAEAAGLQMDRLGIQAAERAAEAAGGGAVVLPPRRAGVATYLIDGPVIFPVSSASPGSLPQLSLSGSIGNQNGVILRPTVDLGPGSAVLSCGDPSGKFANGRGVYANSGSFCSGAWAWFAVRPSSSTLVYGQRPKWGGVPVAMDGIKHGPRRVLDHVTISGFNNGSLFTGDHTETHRASLENNWIGLRMDAQQPNLYGDEDWDALAADGNGWAGLSIAPTTYFNGILDKSYFSSNPYSIYCEPGTNNSQCLQGAAIRNANWENGNCGLITDGSIRDGFNAAGANRTIQDVDISLPFFAGFNAFGAQNAPKPVGGCKWNAYIDFAQVNGLNISGVFENSLALVGGATAIIRVSRTDSYSANRGGITISGNGVWDLMQSQKSYSQSVVDGPGGYSSTFLYTIAWAGVTLRGPGFVARPMPILEWGTASLPIGTLLEYSPSTYDGAPAVERAGLNAGAPIAGVLCQDWTNNNPHANDAIPMVCVGGSHVPILTGTTATVAGLLYSQTATPGTASATASGSPVAMVMGTASATLSYGKALWPGATE